MINGSTPIKGYKVFDSNFSAHGIKFNTNTNYKFEEPNKTFHLCLDPAHCFSYSVFNPLNIVCEVEVLGEVIRKPAESYKVYTQQIRIVSRLTWKEIFTLVNKEESVDTGIADEINTGKRNLGIKNTGDKNNGSWNSGFMNLGFKNTGNNNVGDQNTGSGNTGNKCSGDSCSGYRSSGVFCTDQDPEILIFDKLSGMRTMEWENSRLARIMEELSLTEWIDMEFMNENDKKANPEFRLEGGFLKIYTYQEAWMNLWNKITEEEKKEFINLPNFDSDKFEEITGIKIN